MQNQVSRKHRKLCFKKPCFIGDIQKLTFWGLTDAVCTKNHNVKSNFYFCAM